jgi:hypothetical protein
MAEQLLVSDEDIKEKKLNSFIHSCIGDVVYGYYETTKIKF